MAVNIGSSELLDAYVGPVDDRQPTANTIAYLPMQTDFNDIGPNKIAVTNNNSVSIVSSYGGSKIPVAYFGGASRRLSLTNTYNMNGGFTVHCWFNSTYGIQQWFFTQGSTSTNKLLHLGASSSGRGMVLAFYSNDMDSGVTSMFDGKRHLVTFTYNGGGSTIIYIDGEVLKSGSLTGLATGSNNAYIGDFMDSTGYTFSGYMSRFIIEKIQRTQDEIKKYYEKTKKLYGL